MNRLCAAFWAGLIAYMAARDAGLPTWRDFPMGDAFDFGLTTFLFVLAAIGAVRERRSA